MLGLVCEVFLINLNSDSGFSSPSIMNEPLNILWRQCSELTCEKPNTSLSVSGRPRRSDSSRRYCSSSGLNASPSERLYSVMSSIYTIGSGLRFTLNTVLPNPLYTRSSILSNLGVSSRVSVNCSMRFMPLMPIFWVISTAFVLHGVTISLRGPMKVPLTDVDTRGLAPPKSQESFSFSSWENL